MKRFENKVAVVTGGISGIGLATAERLKEEGARVVITARNRERLDQARKELGDRFLILQADSANVKELEQLFKTVHEKLGKIDALFVNAGVAQFAPTDAVTEEFYDRMTNINTRGAFFTVQKALPFLNDGASIVFNSSVVAQLGMGNTSVYAATKAALVSFTKTLAVELAARKIRVNSVSSGPITTPIYGKMGMPQEALDGFSATIQTKLPAARFGTADEVAHLVAYLASGDAAFVTGQDISIAGGLALNPLM